MSHYILPVFYAVLQLIILIAVGFAARRSRRWDERFFAGLNRFVVRVALPLYFIARIGRTSLSDFAQIITMPIAAVAVVGVGLLLGHALFAVLPYRGQNRRAGIAMAGFGNAGYMPLTIGEIVPISVPIVAELFAPGLVPVLVAAFLFVFSPLLWSLGNTIITTASGEHRGFKPGKLLSPPLVGILIGLVISLSGMPRLSGDPTLPVFHFFQAIERLSAITLPLALVSLGALIGGLKVPPDAFSHYIGLAAAVGLIRFILIPGIFFVLYASGALNWMGSAALFVLFLEMHTPPATNFSLMVGETGVNTEHTAVTLLVGYIVYLVAMPGYLVLLLHLASRV